MTRGQQRALEQHWARYGLDANGPVLDLDAVFGRAAPRVLEIGFGAGEALLALAAANPQHDHIGIEVHRPGVGHLLQGLAGHDLANVRIITGDAVEVLRQRIAPGALRAVLVFFPDPWPKKRHHKRRLVNAEFAALLASRLEPGGLLHIATDWEDYAEQMLRVLETTPGLRNLAGGGGFAERPAWRQNTRFERRGERLGHVVRDLLFEKVPD